VPPLGNQIARFYHLIQGIAENVQARENIITESGVGSEYKPAGY